VDPAQFAARQKNLLQLQSWLTPVDIYLKYTILAAKNATPFQVGMPYYLQNRRFLLKFERLVETNLSALRVFMLFLE
jgi:hypothetical protein